MHKSHNQIPKFGLAVGMAFLLYSWAVVDPNATGDTIETLGVVGTLLMLVTICATFATMFIAAWRAHRAGSWRWFLAVIFFWPLCYLYTLAINRRDE